MKTLWILFGIIFVMSFAGLLWVGTEIFREAPPIPERVVTTDGKTLIDIGGISDGQNVWQAMVGMQGVCDWLRHVCVVRNEIFTKGNSTKT